MGVFTALHTYHPRNGTAPSPIEGALMSKSLNIVVTLTVVQEIALTSE